MGNFGVGISQVFKNGSKLVLPDRTCIRLSSNIYAYCLNKTTKTINKLTNEQLRTHFFLNDPLFDHKNTICINSQ